MADPDSPNKASADSRLTIVSCDCHAGAPPADYRDYLDPAYRALYDQALADSDRVEQRTAQVIGSGVMSSDGDDEGSALSARWTASRRLEQLDADGIVAEVLFPQPAGRAAPPFYNLFGHEMPIHTHGGEGLELGDLPGSRSIFFTEVVWFAHRLFWHLLWSGVLERHPNLRLVFTEQFADWVPPLLKRLDMQYGGTVSSLTLSDGLSMKPSAYWARQCHVGASFMSRDECALRHEIGVPTILWGSDFPHDEGTWPDTAAALHATFDGVPAAELRAMLGENAIRLYGFDAKLLAKQAERLGPLVETFA